MKVYTKGLIPYVVDGVDSFFYHRFILALNRIALHFGVFISDYLKAICFLLDARDVVWLDYEHYLVARLAEVYDVLKGYYQDVVA